MKIPAATFLVLIMMAFVACDAIRRPEEVRACEAFIKERLRSPSTYKQAEANAYGAEPITQEEFAKQYIGGHPDELTKLLKTRVEGKTLALKRVFVKYDAENAYGTPVRDMEMCEFLLVDGDVDGRGGLESRAKSTTSRIQLQQLTEQLNDPALKDLARRHGDSLADCCVRY